MGGVAATQGFFRLFMMPGVDSFAGVVRSIRCRLLELYGSLGREKPGADMIMSAHLKGCPYPRPPAHRSRLDRFYTASVPVSSASKVQGTGDPNKAENFGPVKP